MFIFADEVFLIQNLALNTKIVGPLSENQFLESCDVICYLAIFAPLSNLSWCYLFWSPEKVGRDLRNHPIPSVRPSTTYLII